MNEVAEIERQELVEEFRQLFGEVGLDFHERDILDEQQIRIQTQLHPATIEERLADVIRSIYELQYITITRYELNGGELSLFYFGNHPPCDDLVNFIMMLIGSIQEQLHVHIVDIPSLAPLITGREQVFLRIMENNYCVAVDLLSHNTQLRIQSDDGAFVAIALSSIEEMKQNTSLVNALIADYYIPVNHAVQPGTQSNDEDIAITVLALHEFIAIEYNGKMPVCFLSKFYRLSHAACDYKAVIKSNIGVKHFIAQFSDGMIEYRVLVHNGARRAYLCCKAAIEDIEQVNEVDDELDYTCPITAELIQDPVKGKYANQHFERAAIIDWLRRRQTCPLSNLPMQLDDLEEAPEMRARIEAYRARKRV